MDHASMVEYFVKESAIQRATPTSILIAAIMNRSMLLLQHANLFTTLLDRVEESEWMVALARRNRFILQEPVYRYWSGYFIETSTDTQAKPITGNAQTGVRTHGN